MNCTRPSSSNYRLARAVTGIGARPGQRPSLIVNQISEANGVTDAEMRAALHVCRDLIETGSGAPLNATLNAALTDPASWVAGIGTPPKQPGAASDWRNHLITVAAYRDHHGIDTRPQCSSALSQ